MILSAHTPREYADAIKALLPPGAAWDWPAGYRGEAISIFWTDRRPFTVGSHVGERLWSHAAQDLDIKLYLGPQVGIGDAMLLGTAQELARLEAATPGVLDTAIDTHRPAVMSWHIEDYRRVAAEAVGDLVEALPRHPFAVGCHVGERLWSHAAPDLYFPVELVRVDHLIGPFRVGSHVGERLWGTRSRYVLRVRYYQSVVDPAPLWEALEAFRQAHVFLWFEDITGVGGRYAPN